MVCAHRSLMDQRVKMLRIVFMTTVALSGLMLNSGCAFRTCGGVTRMWADVNTLNEPAFFVEKVRNWNPLYSNTVVCGLLGSDSSAFKYQAPDIQVVHPIPVDSQQGSGQGYSYPSTVPPAPPADNSTTTPSSPPLPPVPSRDLSSTKIYPTAGIHNRSTDAFQTNPTYRHSTDSSAYYLQRPIQQPTGGWLFSND